MNLSLGFQKWKNILILETIEVYILTMIFNLTLLLCDNMLVSSTTLAAEIFNFAQTAARANRENTKEINIRWLSPDGKAVKTSAGFELHPTHSLGDLFERGGRFLGRA